MSSTELLNDLPEEVVSLARMLVRTCRTPGEYTIQFTVSDHKLRVTTAVIARVEKLRVLTPSPRRP